MATQALLALNASGSQVAATCPLYDVRGVRAHRQRFFRDDIPELRYANSLLVPGDKWPARGWVLVRRGDYDQIPSLYATNFQLRIDDLNNGPLLFRNLALVQARCVSRGFAADPNALYLVELTDRRGVLWNRWAHFPTTSQYNVRSPAYPGQYNLASLRGGVPWTWDQLVGDLWGQMLPFLGPYPGLPSVPTGTPEGWTFPGVPVLEALRDVLHQLGMTLSANLLLDAPYGIVAPEMADAAHVALLAKYQDLLEDDYEWIDMGSGRVPGQVIVYFHRRNEVYGTEETVRNDTLTWTANAVYAVTVPAPAPYDAAAGTGHVWSDFTVRFDADSLPLPADVAAAAAVAADQASQYYAHVTRGAQGYSRLVFAGALPFRTGSQTDGVRWYQDFQRPGMDGVSRFGWCTEVLRGAVPPWPEVEVP